MHCSVGLTNRSSTCIHISMWRVDCPGEQWETATAILPQFENGGNTEIGEVNSVRPTWGPYAERAISTRFCCFLLTKYIPTCRKICGLVCATRALAHMRFTQPSPRIFLHFCSTKPGTKNTHRYRRKGRKTADLELHGVPLLPLLLPLGPDPP